MTARQHSLDHDRETPRHNKTIAAIMVCGTLSLIFSHPGTAAKRGIQELRKDTLRPLSEWKDPVTKPTTTP